MMGSAIDIEELKAFYCNSAREFGFESKCRMSVPVDVKGLRVLDVECRRGKGAYQFSERVGQSGSVVGIDSTEAWIDKAREGVDHALSKAGLSDNNMEFAVGYPEATGMDGESFDVVYANASLNLAYDLGAALREFARVLRAGGVLVLDTVVADGERDGAVVDAARELGNAIQAAPALADLLAMLAQAGFGAAECNSEGPVDVDAGYIDGSTVPVAQPVDGATFSKVTLVARKA